MNQALSSRAQSRDLVPSPALILAHIQAIVATATDSISSMALYELHPFHKPEIRKIAPAPGVYVLFQIETPIHAAGAVDLRNALLAAKGIFPQATHFSIEELGPRRGITQRLRKLRKELHLVRALGFAISRRAMTSLNC